MSVFTVSYVSDDQANDLARCFRLPNWLILMYLLSFVNKRSVSVILFFKTQKQSNKL